MSIIGSKDREGDRQHRAMAEQGRDCLEKLEAFKLAELDGMHLWVLKVISEPLAMLFQNLWKLGKVLYDWERANKVSIFKKDEKGGSPELQMSRSNLDISKAPAQLLLNLIASNFTRHIPI